MSNNAIINFLFNSQGAVNQLNDFKSKFSNVVSSIENSAIGKFGAIGASLAGIFSVKSVVDHSRAIGDLQTKYDKLLSLGEISKFSNLFELLGGTDTEAVNTLDKMQKMVLDLSQGKGPDFLRVLGIQARDANGNLKDSVTFMEELREAMKPYSSQQQTKWLEELGVYSPAMKRYMNLQGEELKRYTQQADKMGIVSEESIKRIRKFEESIARLRGSFRKLGDTLLKLGIGKLIDKITNALDKFSELPEPLQQGILGFIAALTLLPAALSITKKVWALVKAFTALSASLAGVAFLAFIVAVIFNIGGLRDVLDDSLASLNKWIAEFSKEHEFGGAFLRQLTELGETILHPINKLKEAYDIYDKLVRDYEESLQRFEDENSLLTKAFPIKAILDWNEAILKFVLHPLETIEGIYNRLGRATGWWTPTDDVSLTQQNVVLSNPKEVGEGLNSDTLEIKNGEVLPKDQYISESDEGLSSDVLGIEKGEVKKAEDNRSYNITFYANFNGINEESSSNIMSQFTRWGNAIEEKLVAYSKNYGG